MAFSIEDHVVIANNVSFDKFLKVQPSQYEEFITTSSTEFYSAVDRYCSGFLELSDEKLQERRAELIIFLFCNF